MPTRREDFPAPLEPHKRLRVLHVTEAFGGGVASALESYVDQTPEFEHGLAFTPAREAPAHADSLSRFSETHDLGHGHIHRTLAVRNAVKAFRPNIVHAHSTYAGVYARAAFLRGTPVVYTPHCYAYHREDFGAPSRAAFRTVEMILRTRTAVFAACSPREARLAPGRWQRRQTILVPNALPEDPRSRAGQPLELGLTLVGIGRANHQKDPLFFAHAAQDALEAGVASRAVWVGDGEPEFTEPLRAAGVEVLGWRSRTETRSLLAEPNTVYVHSALWEGFPIAILEAYVAGAPLIVRDVDSFAGVDFPLVARVPDDVLALIGSVMTPDGHERYASAIESALATNTPDAQQEALRRSYALALGRASEGVRS